MPLRGSLTPPSTAGVVAHPEEDIVEAAAEAMAATEAATVTAADAAVMPRQRRKRLGFRAQCRLRTSPIVV